ncbi:hypothetical protein B296_00023032 [Ensete ventricosum]|uniref:Uncharacterized protein n=1 Tax=Ensete ventricosum TaxID=4639 RepID=A0A427A2P5_ENSVE|nr:hypothetical protein B296_00023032 [Ensete ventricosum]
MSELRACRPLRMLHVTIEIKHDILDNPQKQAEVDATHPALVNNIIPLCYLRILSRLR